MRFLDNGDGIDNAGGSPSTLLKNYIYVTWLWPTNVADPSGFEVAIYTGTNVAATDSYIVPIQKALGSDRHVQVAVTNKVTLSGVNASVRAIYA